MNSCILMAQIVQEPQLRYTADNLAIAEMLVQFPGGRADDPPANLKVVGWGNLAQEIQQNYHQGDRVIIEGRLGMNTVDRPEGFKEKRAELTVQRIHSLGMGGDLSSYASSSAPATAVASRTPEPDLTPIPRPAAVATASPVSVPRYDLSEPVPSTSYERTTYPTTTSPEVDVDDIPF